MKTDTNHSPLPWKAFLNVPMALMPGHIIKINKDPFSPIASVWEGGGTHGKPQQIANALFIERAVNSHYQLVEALEKIKERAEKCTGKEEALHQYLPTIAALAKAALELAKKGLEK